MKRFPILAAAGIALLTALTLVARPTSAQAPVTEVTHVPGQTAISGDGRIAATNAKGTGDSLFDGVVVWDVASGALIAGAGIPLGAPGSEEGTHRFISAPLLDQDGSTIISVFCEFHIATGQAFCSFWQVVAGQEILDLLFRYDDLPIGGGMPLPHMLTADGSQIVFSDSPGTVYRYTIATEEFEEIDAATEICTHEAAAPHAVRGCSTTVAGSSGQWLLVGALDSDPSVANPESYEPKRTLGWLVNIESQEADQIFEIAGEGTGELLDVSDDGARVLYRYQEPGAYPYYLWNRSDPDADRVRIDLLPDGSIPPTGSGALECGISRAFDRITSTDVGDLTPDGKHVAYHARPESAAHQSVFVRNIETGVIRIASPSDDDAALNGCTVRARISDDGKTAVYLSEATNIDSELLDLPFVDGVVQSPTSFVARLGEPVEEPPAEFQLILPNVVRQFPWP